MTVFLALSANEIVSNRELFSQSGWEQICNWLHIPLDRIVLNSLKGFDPAFPDRQTLKGMTEAEYWEAEAAVRMLASKFNVPPIWFEDAWSSNQG